MTVSDRFVPRLYVSVERFDEWLMKIVVAMERFYYFSSAYALQSSRSDRAKHEFWSCLLSRQQKYRRRMPLLLQVTSVVPVVPRKSTTAVMGLSVALHAL